MEPVMLSFLAPTENTKWEIRTTEFTIAGKYLRKQQEIAIRNFQIQSKTRVEPSYPEIGGEIITRKEYNYSNRTRVNLQRKGGQLECPNGSDKNSNSRVKTYFCY